MKRVIFYFDGFNFYNGLKDISKIHPQWKNYYWLDLFKFCSQFIDREHSIVKIKYFTAVPSENEKRSRQSAFFSANKMLNGDKIEIINGIYQNKNISCRKCRETYVSQEEKRTDVNIAIAMLMDCFNDKTDTLVLISADSDQIPTIEAIKCSFPNKKVKVYFPPERNSAQIRAISNTVIYLGDNENKFKNAVMPAIVIGLVKDISKKYTKPEKWKYQ